MSDNTRRCRHIKTNGIQCGSPALRDRDFCHYHRQAYIDFPLRRAPRSDEKPALNLGFMEDPDGIHYALTHMVYGVLNGTIDHKSAGLALYALQTMSSNFKQTSFHRQQEDEYRSSELNAYELWDNLTRESNDRRRKEIFEKRKAELAQLERTCCKCKDQFQDPAALSPELPLMKQQWPLDPEEEEEKYRKPASACDINASEESASSPGSATPISDFRSATVHGGQPCPVIRAISAIRDFPQQPRGRHQPSSNSPISAPFLYTDSRERRNHSGWLGTPHTLSSGHQFTLADRST